MIGRPGHGAGNHQGEPELGAEVGRHQTRDLKARILTQVDTIAR